MISTDNIKKVYILHLLSGKFLNNFSDINFKLSKYAIKYITIML